MPSVLLPGDWAVKLDLAHGKIFNLDGAVLTLYHSLLSCTNKSVPSEVSKIYLEGESLPVFGSMLWYHDGRFS